MKAIIFIILEYKPAKCLEHDKDLTTEEQYAILGPVYLTISKL